MLPDRLHGQGTLADGLRFRGTVAADRAEPHIAVAADARCDRGEPGERPVGSAAWWHSVGSRADSATVQTATLDYTGPRPDSGQPTRPAQHRILTGTDLHALADVLNTLPALPPGTYSCSSDDGEQAVLTVAHSQFTMELSGCRQVTVEVEAVAQPVLEAALTDGLSRAIHGMLGDTPISSGGHGPSPAQ